MASVVPPNTPPTGSLPPIATPTHGAPTIGSFTIATSSHIDASPLRCVEAILDAASYPKWNTFCRSCKIISQPTTPQTHTSLPSGDEYLRLGTRFTFDVHLDPSSPPGTTGRPQSMEVTILEPIDEPSRKGWRVAWKLLPTAMMPEWALRTERIQEFVETDGGKGTDYVEPSMHLGKWNGWLEWVLREVEPKVAEDVRRRLIETVSLMREQRTHEGETRIYRAQLDKRVAEDARKRFHEAIEKLAEKEGEVFQGMEAMLNIFLMREVDKLAAAKLQEVMEELSIE
ncbi:hypothetical protein OQA88_12057 [Cercophora sp. LCS_1]